MDRDDLKRILAEFQRGERRLDELLELFARLPYQDVGLACLDTHRGLRSGLGEVVFALDKSPVELETIIGALAEGEGNILVTRLAPEKATFLLEKFSAFEYHEAGRYLVRLSSPLPEDRGRGEVLIITAGTSDLKVAYEAEITVRMMGQKVSLLNDVGVAGIHRLLAHRERLLAAEVLIVIAGMEGALPSVVAGLVDRPVIAVPTSTGYGTAFGGVTALLGMLNSCAAGIGVVNIDNGFGAGCVAGQINRRRD
jgi:NCAIR mutase (PurE)-related protein